MTNDDPPADFRVLEFGLAPLQPIDPASLLSGDDDVDGFVLSLALAYNDVKTIHWMNFILQKHQPSECGELTADAGQWNAMRVQVVRWLMALAYEIIRAIAHAHEMKILTKPQIRNVLRALPAPYQRLWKELVAIATKPSGTGATLRPYLSNLRNEGVFHYKHPTRLLTAYRSHFVTDPKTKFNERAYVSVGPTLNKTRFYFADAAAQRMYVGDATLEERFQQSQTFIDELHHTLCGFVWGYMRSRQK